MAERDEQIGQNSLQCASERPALAGPQGPSSPSAGAAMQLQHPASDAAEAAPPQLVAPSPVPGVVLHGTCGWSDASLVRCGRFYPAAVKVGSSSEDKLRHYRCV